MVEMGVNRTVTRKEAKLALARVGLTITNPRIGGAEREADPQDALLMRP